MLILASQSPRRKELLGLFHIPFTVRVADINEAIAKDQLSGTINYAEAYEVVKREMNIPSQLLEHVCGRIGTALLHHFPTLQQVQVSVTKHNPPIEGAGNCQSAVTLSIKR